MTHDIAYAIWLALTSHCFRDGFGSSFVKMFGVDREKGVDDPLASLPLFFLGWIASVLATPDFSLAC